MENQEHNDRLDAIHLQYAFNLESDSLKQSEVNETSQSVYHVPIFLPVMEDSKLVEIQTKMNDLNSKLCSRNDDLLHAVEVYNYYRTCINIGYSMF